MVVGDALMGGVAELPARLCLLRSGLDAFGRECVAWREARVPSDERSYTTEESRRSILAISRLKCLPSTGAVEDSAALEWATSRLVKDENMCVFTRRSQ